MTRPIYFPVALRGAYSDATAVTVGNSPTLADTLDLAGELRSSTEGLLASTTDDQASGSRDIPTWHFYIYTVILLLVAAGIMALVLVFIPAQKPDLPSIDILPHSNTFRDMGD